MSRDEEDVCERVRKACEENEREIAAAARRSHMTVQEFEDYYWECERKARHKVDDWHASKGLAPIDWQPGMSAQGMLLSLQRMGRPD